MVGPGSVEADLVEEPGDDVPQGVARHAPDQHHQDDYKETGRQRTGLRYLLAV
jgi:hypothetical protein